MSAPALTIVIPTFNERSNIALLADRLASTLSGLRWEAIFVDDNSPDGTSEEVRAVVARDPRIRLICRIGRRGLAGAALEGILAAQGRYVAVMDADLQHDDGLLPQMLSVLKSGEADLVVGSRYIAGGATAGFSAERQAASRFAGALAKLVLRARVADPMSGFFMMPTALAVSIAPKLWNSGFKLLMDILLTSRGSVRVRELPYLFQARRHGSSKLDSSVALDFFFLLLARVTGNILPPRSLAYVLVGSTGVVTHMAALWLLSRTALAFPPAQMLATWVAMTGNFFFNNAFTYRDRRLRGLEVVRGLLVFYAVCGIGAVSNVSIASWIFASSSNWWIAGFAGAFIGAVWNYSISSALVWRLNIP